jgi:mannose-6-phosphate isomerase-like protein (cupin superfamily)
MKMVHKINSVTHQHSEYFIAREYPMEDKDINLAVVNISKRQPEKGYFVNEVCKELVLISKGEGSITFKDGMATELKEGDSILIEPNEMYFWEGDFSLTISCTPAWYPEQHKTIQAD